MRSIVIYLTVILLILTGCVESFTPDIPASDSNLLVVEGTITDGEGPHQIRFSRSATTSAEAFSLVAVKDALIEDKDGNLTPLVENDQGIFETANFTGEAGQSYRLLFSLNGNEYESSWIKLNAAPPIDSVYYEFTERGTTDPDNPIKGVQFYLDAHGTAEDSPYYRWAFEETWIRVAPLYGQYEYLGNDRTKLLNPLRYQCWEYASPQDIILGSTNNLAENTISAQPLLFVKNAKLRFSKRYSLLIKQFILSEPEYNFWKATRTSNEELGGLYAKQPGKIESNITNMTHPDEVILGYFGATGVSEKRVFIEYGEVPRSWYVPPIGCALDTIAKSSTSDEEVFAAVSKGRRFLDFHLSPPPFENIIGYIIAESLCTDCDFKSGTIEKPPFW